MTSGLSLDFGENYGYNVINYNIVILWKFIAA